MPLTQPLHQTKPHARLLQSHFIIIQLLQPAQLAMTSSYLLRNAQRQYSGRVGKERAARPATANCYAFCPLL